MSRLSAKSVMTDSVVSVSPEASLLTTLRLFVEEDIHGAPVVDDEGQPVGVITSSDVLRAQHDEVDTAAAEADYLRDSVEFSTPDATRIANDFQDRLAQRTVAEAMTRGVISVPPEAAIEDIARCMRENKIHRVWVEEDGRLLGVVSALDLMPVVERELRST